MFLTCNRQLIKKEIKLFCPDGFDTLIELVVLVESVLCLSVSGKQQIVHSDLSTNIKAI